MVGHVVGHKVFSDHHSAMYHAASVWPKASRYAVLGATEPKNSLNEFFLYRAKGVKISTRTFFNRVLVSQKITPREKA